MIISSEFYLGYNFHYFNNCKGEMELNEKFIQDILKKRELQSKGSDGFSINLSGYQIEDWGEPMKYIVYILKVDLFDLSSNYLTRIMPELKNFDRLKELNLSENLIESGVELQGHPSLEILDLSNNKLSGSLNGFENMPILKILRLAGNNISKIEGINLPLLKSIDLSCNDIKVLEGIETLASLEQLYISKNLLNDIDYLLVMKPGKLRVLDVGFNRLPFGYLDPVVEILKQIQSLREVIFGGNEVAMNKMYRIRVSPIPHLTHLDGIEIRDYARRQLDDLQTEDEIDKLIRETREEYHSRLSSESKLKDNLIEMLELQKQTIESQYNSYRRETEGDELHFLKWAHEVKKNLKTNNKKELIENWKRQLVEQDALRRRLARQAEEAQKKLERNLVQKKLVTTQFSKKLYEISMQAPETWKELKKLEYDNIQFEQQGNHEYEPPKPTTLKKSESRENFEQFEEDMLFDNALAVTEDILGGDMRQLKKQENEAASKIANQARVRFNLANNESRNDSTMQEINDMIYRHGGIQARYEPDSKIDETSREDNSSEFDQPRRFYQDQLELEPLKNKKSPIESSRMLLNGSRVIGDDSDIWNFMHN